MQGISVIVPIYNVEPYIDECLTSLQQSMRKFENVEVILVNDGSTDASGTLAQNFSATDTRFNYIEQSNKGLSNARNTGVGFAQFDYVAFVDSDDEVCSNYFHVLLQAIKSGDDLYIFKAYLKNKEQLTVLAGMDVPGELWTMQSNAGFKLYRRSLFSRLAFTEGLLYEDVLFTYQLPAFVKTYHYIPLPLYVYRVGREGSLLNTMSEKINDMYTVFERLIAFYEVYNIKNAQRGLTYQYMKLVMWSNTYRQLKLHRLSVHRYLRAERRAYKMLKLHFSDWRENDLIDKNASFFEDRFGSRYHKTIEKLGATCWSTLWASGILLIKNRHRLRG